MKLEKAIEILTVTVQIDEEFAKTEETEATRLGIEALKLLQTLRMIPEFGIEEPLPGETTEEET